MLKPRPKLPHTKSTVKAFKPHLSLGSSMRRRDADITLSSVPQTPSSRPFDPRQLLGHTPTSPKLLAALGRLATAIDTAFPKVEAHEHNVWFRYVDLGLSLGFRPVDGYVPAEGAEVDDLDMSKLELAEVTLYNSHKLQQDPAFPFLPLVIPPPRSASQATTPAVSRSNSVSSNASGRSHVSMDSKWPAPPSLTPVSSLGSSGFAGGLTSGLAGMSTLDSDRPSTPGTPGTPGGALPRGSVELTETAMLQNFIKTLGDPEESLEEPTPSNSIVHAPRTQIVKVWPKVAIKAQFAAPPGSDMARQFDSRWLTVSISDADGFDEDPPAKEIVGEME
ncbi:hypothetical protein E3P86_01927 [Wallemia ichthyophaga]|uniref:Uncharacterized protein n=1 Tax=Wallemia ichthyophaga TaxID=245174 RepID=A0A4T0J765_WALIC|nr:hypothetical protein E3P86_01927 [Wallemia ichthyophaga]